MNETKTINHAMSTNNGIICYSNLIPFMCVRTYYDEEGVIRKEERFGISMLDAIEEDSYVSVRKKETDKFIIIMAFILTILLVLISQNIFFAIILLYLYSRNTFEYYYMFYLMIIEFKTKGGIKKSLSKFHAAEHKVINAYTKKQAIPTFEEVKQASKFSEKCGTMPLFNKIVEDTAYVVVLMLFSKYINVVLDKIDKTKIGLYIITCIISAAVVIAIFTIIFNFIKNKGLLKFMQIFATDEPTEKEINLAIAAVQNFEELEENILSGNLKSVKILYGSDGFKEFCFEDDEDEEES